MPYLNKDPSENFVIKTPRLRKEKSISQLVRINAVYFGIELLFSIEVALTVPILKKLGVSDSSYSYVYFLSPLLGFLFQPVLGVLSDRCENPLGRRRPFILALSILAFLGIIFILNGNFLASYIFADHKRIAITLIYLGVTLLDFSADSCDCSLRAYILDVCNNKDRDTGLNVNAILGGLGCSMGYVLSSIDWNRTYIASSLGSDEAQILTYIVTIVFVSCLIITMKAATEKKFSIKHFDVHKRADSKMLMIYDENEEYLKEDDEPPAGLETLLKSLLKRKPTKMPRELVLLLISQTTGWLAFFSTYLFFTDFIADSIYKGDSQADVDSIQYLLYDQGVKMGSFCLVIFSLSSSLFGFVLEKFLMKRYSLKQIYSLTFVFYGISCGIIYLIDNIYVIMVLCTSFGVIFTSLSSIPHQLLSDYHLETSYRDKSPEGTKRGFGIDCSLLCSCCFLSQFLASFMGNLTSKYGNSAILLFSAILSCFNLIFVLFWLVFPTKRKSESLNFH